MSGPNAYFDPDEDALNDAHGIAGRRSNGDFQCISFAVAPVYNWFAALPYRFDSLHP